MSLLAKITPSLTVLMFIISTTLSVSGDAVICLAPDHIAFETGSADGAGHCSPADEADHHASSLHPFPQRCIDLTLAALQLDLPRRGIVAAATTASPPIAVVAADTLYEVRPACGPAPWIARPPPSLPLIRLTVLRL